MTPVAASHRLIVVVGPSGAGKDSVLRAWLQHAAAHSTTRLHVAQRAVTRPANGHEAHEPITPATWHRGVEDREFALHWHANNLYYGVRWRELGPLMQGTWVILNGSRGALPQVRKRAPAAHIVHITASPDLLAERLAARGREDAAEIRARLLRSPPVKADFTVDNSGSLSDTVSALDDWWQQLLVTAQARRA